jgi:anti-sigma B factor antagonist
MASGNATDSAAVRAARSGDRSIWITRPSSTNWANSASSDAPGAHAVAALSIETVSNETVAATTEAYGVGPMEVRRHRGWTVVEVTGDLEMASAPALRQLVVQLLSTGARQIAVDLTAVDFLDSIGIGMLVAALKRVRTHDGELVVICPEPRLRRIFELTELVSVFGLLDSADDLPKYRSEGRSGRATSPANTQARSVHP